MWTRLVGLAVVAAAGGGAAADQRITPSGVGDVKLGRAYQALRSAQLVGRVRPGCELAPNRRAAPLRAPLVGSVDFTRSSPRKVARIAVRGGATARGVGIGATSAAIRAAYPAARFDHSTEEIFGVTLVKVPKGGGGRLEFAVNAETRKVTVIGVPSIAFCE